MLISSFSCVGYETARLTIFHTSRPIILSFRHSDSTNCSQATECSCIIWHGGGYYNTCKTPPHANSATGENKTKTEAGPMRKIWAVSWVTIWSGMSSSKKLYELCDNTGTPSVLFAIIQVRFIDRANRCTLSTVFQKFVRVLTFVHSHSKRDNNFRFELIASLQLSRASSFLC